MRTNARPREEALDGDDPRPAEIVCPLCNVTQQRLEFYLSSYHRKGYHPHCRTCQAKKAKAWREAKPKSPEPRKVLISAARRIIQIWRTNMPTYMGMDGAVNELEAALAKVDGTPLTPDQQLQEALDRR